MAKLKNYSILLFIFLGISTVHATTISSRMVALQDSLKIGEIGKIALVVDYPESKNVMFPDTTFKHENIEIISKTYFHTSRIDSITLRDSAIYSIQSFRTSSPLRISFPVFILTAFDTIEIKTDSLNLALTPLLFPLKKDLKFNSFTSFLKPNLPLHPAIIGSIVIVVILILVVLIKILYRPIQQKIQIYQLKKSYKKLETLFTNVHKQDFNEQNILSTLKKWHSFLGKLEGKSYSSKTLKEIRQLTGNELIKNNIKNIETRLYSNNKSEETNLTTLLFFAKEKLDLKISQIKAHEK